MDNKVADRMKAKKCNQALGLQPNHNCTFLSELHFIDKTLLFGIKKYLTRCVYHYYMSLWPWFQEFYLCNIFVFPSYTWHIKDLLETFHIETRGLYLEEEPDRQFFSMNCIMFWMNAWIFLHQGIAYNIVAFSYILLCRCNSISILISKLLKL